MVDRTRSLNDGAITVPAKLFTDFVNSLPAGPTELSLNVRTKTVHLRRDPYEANFKGMDAEEFQRQAELAKRECPVSLALAGVGEITVDAQLDS